MNRSWVFSSSLSDNCRKLPRHDAEAVGQSRDWVSWAWILLLLRASRRPIFPDMTSLTCSTLNPALLSASAKTWAFRFIRESANASSLHITLFGDLCVRFLASFASIKCKFNRGSISAVVTCVFMLYWYLGVFRLSLAVLAKPTIPPIFCTAYPCLHWFLIFSFWGRIWINSRFRGLRLQ